MLRRPLPVLWMASLLLAACSGPSNLLRGDPDPRPVPIPSETRGSARARGADRSPASSPASAPASREELEAVAARRLGEAAALWRRAEALEERNPDAAADLFEDVVDDYPEYERAAEAKFREGRARFRAGDYPAASRALQRYMQLAPVNPHLAEVEQLIYESGVRWLNRSSGLFGFLSTDDVGLEALQYVPETFPAGSYADDALLALGDYYREDGDPASAALHYKELLLRYPDSEWSFRARLRLGDTYLARDQGTAYHAGFVDLDPRESMGGEEARRAGPIRSAVELALEQYEAFLERMEADPGRRVEYAEEIAYAERQRQECRERLAAKDLHVAEWLEGRGDASGAQVYYRAAAGYEGTRAGTIAARRIRGSARVAPSPRPAPAPRPRPAATSPTVTPAPAPRPAPAPTGRTRVPPPPPPPDLPPGEAVRAPPAAPPRPRVPPPPAPPGCAP